ncbi:MAG: hypothetical protein RR531_05145 [Longicatena sp.]
MKKLIKEYVHCINALIPINSKESKEFIISLNKKIIRSYENCEIHNYTEMITKFGSPNEVAISYINGIEPEQIIKQLDKKKHLSFLMYTGIFAIILIGITGILKVNQEYEGAADSLLNIRIETTITENPIPQEGE